MPRRKLARQEEPDILFFMTTKWFDTGNSHTPIAYDSEWLVLDIGSGHNPHPRANILADKFLLDNNEVVGRSGRKAVVPQDRFFVVADACALPFKDKAFQFIIASHIAEHVEDIDSFCYELNRVGSRGYLETPSKLAEVLRHPPYHIWYVSNRKGTLVFEPAPRDDYPLGWMGKLFFSIYFYQSPQLKGKDVFEFAHGASPPIHHLLRALRIFLVRSWLFFKPLTYTRLQWEGSFSWKTVRPANDELCPK